ncbi:MAG: S1/P1 nuclease [Legionellaceae bacterium]
MVSISRVTLRFFCVCLMLGYGSLAFSWNAVGHRIIAQIAQDQMTPHAIARFNAWNDALNTPERRWSLVDASTWLDVCRSSYPGRFDEMHYIDIPFTEDGSSLEIKQPFMNAVVALEQSKVFLLDKTKTPHDRAVALRMMLHLVGDIHQPLHAVTRVSRHYKKGDKGGNLVYLRKNKVAKNLHAYWDRGAGALILKKKKSMDFVIKTKAMALEKQWPCVQVDSKFNPEAWAHESHLMAKIRAYPDLKGHVVTRSYERMTKEITDQRLAFAGCRLAQVLNKIDNSLSIEL